MIGSITARGHRLARSWLGHPALDISTDPADVQSVTIATTGLGVTGPIVVPYGEELAGCAIASRRWGRR